MTFRHEPLTLETEQNQVETEQTDADPVNDDEETNEKSLDEVIYENANTEAIENVQDETVSVTDKKV